MYLFKYILKRIVLMLFTFLVIITLCFIFIKLLPNIPAEQFGKDMALIMQRREMLGYDLPIMQQYWRFWKYAFQGYFGTSEVLYIGQDVWKVFVQKIPFTVAVNVFLAQLKIILLEMSSFCCCSCLQECFRLSR